MKTAGKIFSAILLISCLIPQTFAQDKNSKPEAANKKENKSNPKPTQDTSAKKENNSDSKLDLQWLETFVGEIVSLNPNTRRLIIRSVKNGRTKLISISKETVVERGNNKLTTSELKRGQNVLIKYDFLESNARVISILDEKSPNNDKSPNNEKPTDD